MTFTTLGQPFVVLSSAQYAADIMEKKSAIYSSRASFPVAGDMVGLSEALVLEPYGERMRDTRKLISQVMGTPKRVEQFHPLVEDKVRQFLVGLAGRTDTLNQAIKQYVSCTLAFPARAFIVLRMARTGSSGPLSLQSSMATSPEGMEAA